LLEHTPLSSYGEGVVHKIIFDPMPENLTQYSDIAFTMGINVTLALVILIAGWTIGKWVGRRLRKLMLRSDRVDDMLAPVLSSLVKYLILAIAAIAALERFGVQTASIIAVLGAAGLAIGLALQGALSNLASGFLLLFFKPIKTQEYVDIGSAAGTVEEVGLFRTILSTHDGIYVSVPNNDVWSNRIQNYTRNDTRRFDVEIGIGYDDNVDRALDLLTDYLANDERVLKDPNHEVMVKSLGGSSVNINLRGWVNKDDFFPVQFDINRYCKELLEKEGFSIPYPQQDLHIKSIATPLEALGGK
jgi:small conductance mechanosensitive channel